MIFCLIETHWVGEFVKIQEIFKKFSPAFDSIFRLAIPTKTSFSPPLPSGSLQIIGPPWSKWNPLFVAGVILWASAWPATSYAGYPAQTRLSAMVKGSVSASNVAGTRGTNQYIADQYWLEYIANILIEQYQYWFLKNCNINIEKSIDFVSLTGVVESDSISRVYKLWSTQYWFG